MRIQISEDQFLEFDGELLGSASSSSDKPRWMDVNIYGAADGRYIVQKIGRTSLVGERDYYSAHVVDDAPSLITALRSKKRGVVFMTIVAEDAVRAAMEKDPRISEAWHVVTLV